MIEIFTYESIKQVPQEWDTLVGDNIYMTGIVKKCAVESRPKIKYFI